MKRLIACLLTFSSLLHHEAAKACGFYAAPGEYRFSIFQPLIAPQPELSPFYFSSYYQYGSLAPDAETAHYDENVREWYQYLGKKVSEESIYEAQYLLGAGQVFPADSVAEQNAFLNLLKQKKYRDEQAYFKLAKAVEGLQVFDPWGNEPNELADTAGVNQLMADGQKLYNHTRSTFLKYRIAYQLIRLCLFTRNQAEGDRVYQKMFLPVVPANSWIKGTGTFFWALLSEQSQPALCYYRLTLALDGFSNKRSACLRKIPMMGIDSILPYAATPRQQAMVYSARALQYPGKSLDDLRKIYQLDPTNADLDFMFIREVNKLEDLLKTPEYTDYDFGPAIADSWFQVSGLQEILSGDRDVHRQHDIDVAYAQTLHSFIDSVIADKKRLATTNLHLCAAQLSLMLRHTAESKLHLDAAAKQPLNAAQQLQLQTGQYLLNMLATKKFDRSAEDFLLRILQAPDSTLPVLEEHAFKQQLVLMTARVMLENKDSARGILMLGQTDRGIGLNPVAGYKTVFLYLQEHGSPAIYDELISIISSPKKSKLERYLVLRPARYPFSVYVDDEIKTGPRSEAIEDWLDAQRWTVARMQDYKGTWYYNHDNLDSAVAVLARVPADYWAQAPFTTCLTGDPIYPANARPYDPNDVMPRSKTKSMTRLAFVQQLKALQQRYATHVPERFALSMKIAAMHFQSSYYGEYWLMSKPYWSSGDFAQARSVENDRYYGASLALHWYLQAMKEAKNQEQAGVAALMARYCDQLYFNYTNSLQTGLTEPVVYTETIGPMLEKRFKHTPYYDMILEACK
jgi:hypothetical protein